MEKQNQKQYDLLTIIVQRKMKMMTNFENQINEIKRWIQTLDHDISEHYEEMDDLKTGKVDLDND